MFLSRILGYQMKLMEMFLSRIPKETGVVDVIAMEGGVEGLAEDHRHQHYKP